MKIYILMKVKTYDDERTNVELTGVTESVDLVERWKDTTSYIKHEEHIMAEYDTEDAEAVVTKAEEIEKERAKKYGEGDYTGTEGTVL